ncbi:MAG: hypothetical protein AAF353_14260, partial [Pseudomonadota bacterium]
PMSECHFMKCPNCSSQMFVADKSETTKSQLTFYRCGICGGEHVSSQAIVEAASPDSTDYFENTSTESRRYLMV